MNLEEIMMHKVYEKCDFLLEGNVISREMISRVFEKYLAMTAQKDDHNIGVILHTGSAIFDAIAIAFASISNLILNDTGSEDVILSLQDGDYVLYGEKKKERYIFRSIVPDPKDGDGEYVMLTQGEHNKIYVPPKRWNLISPYYGSSKRTDGRGIRIKNTLKAQFYQQILEYQATDIPSIIDTATVLLMARERADYILKNLSLRFGKTIMPILDLVTASYYTENEEFYYGGNTGKVDPVLKITSKASVARRLIRKKDGNRCIGLMVFGDDIINKNVTELPELIERKSLKYVYMLMHIDSANAFSTIDNHQQAVLFACTKDFLLSNSTTNVEQNRLTAELSKQIDAVVERDLTPVIISGSLSWKDYKTFKKALLYIKNSEYVSESKDTFIIQAYSLMNLFLTSAFMITDVEEAVSRGAVDIDSPSGRMKQLTEISSELPASLSESAKAVIDILEELYLNLTVRSEKESELIDLIQRYSSSKIALVVPKAYYAVIFRDIGLYNLMKRPDWLTISTANKFDNTKVYDIVITLGDYVGKRFDVFRCRSAQMIVSLLYDFESNIFKYRLKKSEAREKMYDSRSGFDYPIESQFADLYYEDNETESEISLIEGIETEVDDYIIRLNEQSALNNYGTYGSMTGGTAEIVAVATFESGETALFTKMYKAYILSEEDEDVKEIGVEDISEGDSIVFTKNNENTHDIVDELLGKLVDSGRLNDQIKKQYSMSKRWKEDLINYLHESGSSEKAIAQALIANGVSVQEITIRTWLDVDAHTVGPRKLDSIQQIALLVNDEELFENAEQYYEACNSIRRIRREILKEIGRAIIEKLKGTKPREGMLIADVYSRIDSLAEILTVETISPIKRRVPINDVNRPIRKKEMKANESA